MAQFASELADHSARVSAGGSVTFAFGPATPGKLEVFLAAYEALRRSRRLRDGTTSRLVFAARLRPKPVKDSPTAPGGGNEFEPVPPDTEPPSRLDPMAFLVEVFDARGQLVGKSDGPLTIEVPETPTTPTPGGTAAAPVAVQDTWQVRVTNKSAFEAGIVVNIRFYGVRPILTKPFEIGFVNGRFDTLFNDPQPIWLRFENRTVSTFPGPQGPVEIKHTFLVLDALQSWKDAHSVLRDFAVSLGALVLTEVTASTEISVRACVHDGWPAIRVYIRFLPDTGEIDLINLLSLYSRGLANLADFVVDVTPKDRPRIAIEQLALEVFFVLRARPFDAKAIFQVIAQPTVDFDSPVASKVGRALAQLLFEIAVPNYLGRNLDRYADTFASWLLGDRGRSLVSGIEQLDIRYVGDAPRPQVVAPTTVSPTAVPLDPGNLSKVDHIVVVMMENRSFDHMLGYLSLPSATADDIVGRGRTDVDGLTGNEFNHAGWLGRGGAPRVGVFPLSRAWEGERPPRELQTRPTRFAPNPGYTFERIKTQRGGFNIELNLPGRNDPSEPNRPITVTIGKNGGFVLDFASRLTGLADSVLQRRLAGEVMGYHPAEHVPTYDFLAQNFAVCDRWFASHPGETWPNRFLSLTGQLAVGPNGLPQLNNPSSETFDPLDTSTIFDHLIAAGVSCQYYEYDFCMLRVFQKYTFDDTTIVPIDDPDRGFFAVARQGKLPSVSWIEPDLTGIDVGNDDHPPADVMDGQRFVRRVYDALANSPQWDRTLLIITYDEHGGFYDHVHPEEQALMSSANPLAGGFVPIALDPSTLSPVNYYGMRVPAFIVSPWVGARSVPHDVFDHASILKTIIVRFLKANPPDMGWRVAHAKHVGPVLSERRLRQSIAVMPNLPLAPPRVLLRPLLRREQPDAEDFGEFLRRFRDRVLA